MFVFFVVSFMLQIISFHLIRVCKCRNYRNLPFIFLYFQMLSYSFRLHVQFKSSEGSRFVFIEVELKINTVYLSDNWQIILCIYKVRPPVKNTILEMMQTSCVVLVLGGAVEIEYLFIYLLPFEFSGSYMLWEKFIFLVCYLALWIINKNLEKFSICWMSRFQWVYFCRWPWMHWECRMLMNHYNQ